VKACSQKIRSRARWLCSSPPSAKGQYFGEHVYVPVPSPFALFKTAKRAFEI
jgi:hypothetical protein